MANIKISQLPNDDVLSGTEKLTGIDAGVNKNITVAQITAYVLAQVPAPGAATFAALTDKTSVDLPAINAPLAAALTAVSGGTGSGTFQAEIPTGVVDGVNTHFTLANAGYPFIFLGGLKQIWGVDFIQDGLNIDFIEAPGEVGAAPGDQPGISAEVFSATTVTVSGFPYAFPFSFS